MNKYFFPDEMLNTNLVPSLDIPVPHGFVPE